MKIIIRTKNIELTKSFKNFIEEKIGSLKKFIDILKKEENKNTLAEVFFETQKESKHHNKGQVFRSEAMILLPGKKIVAQSAGDDLLLTVVEIKDKLQQEIKKYKLKKIESPRREQRKNKK
ncbi:MAG: ribosome-associated translation inhibitor RaiA [Patescibacteria group bacterium]